MLRAVAQEPWLGRLDALDVDGHVPRPYERRHEVIEQVEVERAHVAFEALAAGV